MICVPTLNITSSVGQSNVVFNGGQDDRCFVSRVTALLLVSNSEIHVVVTFKFDIRFSPLQYHHTSNVLYGALCKCIKTNSIQGETLEFVAGVEKGRSCLIPVQPDRAYA